MGYIRKLFFSSLLGGIFFSFCVSGSYAFLGEDLGLDLYKKVDEGFYELQRKQYEYEMTGQGEASVDEVVGPILQQRGLDCDINTTDEIEILLGNSGEEQIRRILSACNYSGEKAPSQVAEEVISGLTYIKNTFSSRAIDKSNATYEVARIGLYNDGNIENSPFDLISDLEEIDRIIFSEELEYNGVPWDTSMDEKLDNFLEEDKDYLYEEDEEEEIIKEESEEEIITLEGEFLEEGRITEESITHNYVCVAPEIESGLGDEELDEILGEIENPGGYTPYVNLWEYPDDPGIDGSLWGGPNNVTPYSGTYNSVTDEWGCDPNSFFCIIISFENANYGLAGGETVTIEKILAKAAKHLEKPANASLTQHKMQTNNFEIGADIKNLPDMLRGFGIEVQSKPIPILEELEGSDRPKSPEEEIVEEMLRTRYKNLTLDYDRRNDLQIFGKISRNDSSELEQKIIETSADMPTPYVEERLAELSKFQAALSENNRILSLAVDKQILYEDMDQFGTQFAQIERFVAAIEDFVEAFTGHVQRLEKIPLKSS